MDNKNKEEALLEFFQRAYSEDFTGVKDQWEDAFDVCMEGLTDKEIADLVITTFRKGI